MCYHLLFDQKTLLFFQPPPQLFYDAPVVGELYANETIEDIRHFDEDGAMTDTNKYACEYFYYLLEKEESDFTLKVNQKVIKHISGIYKPNTRKALHTGIF